GGAGGAGGGTNYYVSTTGSDSTGNGTSASPWRSILKACQSVPSGQGATINVGPGTFTETATCTLPTGISLIGAGQSQTTVIPATAFTPLLSLGGSTQTVSDITFDGQNKTRSRQCIVATGTINAKFLRLTIRSFTGAAYPDWQIGGGLH